MIPPAEFTCVLYRLQDHVARITIVAAGNGGNP